MKAWEEYAYIVNETVIDIATFQINSGAYTLANKIAKDVYGDTAIAVEVTQYPVNIGDKYIGGIFLRDGRHVHRLPTEEESIEVLQIQNNSMSESIDELIIAITPG